ncbi:hypothetical protein Tco_0012827 [Tanacetum coccineum]
MANDDPILTTMRFIPQHEVVQRYGAILPDYLTNPAMKESEVYKTYHDLATGKAQLKPKYIRRSSRTKSEELPKPSSDIALTEAEQMKLAIKRSKTQLHISQPSNFGVHKGTGVTPEVPDFSTHDDEAKQDEEVNEEDSFDPRVQTPLHVESTDDEEVQGVNIEGEEMDEEANNEEDEGNELY